MSDPVNNAFEKLVRDLGPAGANAVYEFVQSVMDMHEEDFHRESAQQQSDKP